jgi:hypothetical protein
MEQRELNLIKSIAEDLKKLHRLMMTCDEHANYFGLQLSTFKKINVTNYYKFSKTNK